MKKKIIILIAFISIVCILIWFVKSDSRYNQNANKYLLSRIVQDSLVLKKNIVIADAYKLQLNDTNLFVITQTKSYQITNSSQFEVPLGNDICALFKKGDTIIAFDNKKEILIKSINNKVVQQKWISNADYNILMTGNDLFYATVSSNLNEGYMIKNAQGKDEIDISKSILPLLNNVDSFCKSNYTEGQMTLLNDSLLVYYPFRTNRLIVKNLITQKQNLYKTIDSSDIIKMKKIEVNLGERSKMIKCEAVEGEKEFINSAITTNKKFLIMNPDITIKEKENLFALIDFYNTKNLEYLYSKKMRLLDKEEYLLDIKCNDEVLYLLTSKGIIYKTFL